MNLLIHPNLLIFSTDIAVERDLGGYFVRTSPFVCSARRLAVAHRTVRCCLLSRVSAITECTTSLGFKPRTTHLWAIEESPGDVSQEEVLLTLVHPSITTNTNKRKVIATVMSSWLKSKEQPGFAHNRQECVEWGPGGFVPLVFTNRQAGAGVRRSEAVSRWGARRVVQSSFRACGRPSGADRPVAPPVTGSQTAALWWSLADSYTESSSSSCMYYCISLNTKYACIHLNTLVLF